MPSYFLFLIFIPLITPLIEEVKLNNSDSAIQEISTFFYPESGGFLEINSVTSTSSDDTCYLMVISTDWLTKHCEELVVRDPLALGNLLIDKTSEKEEEGFSFFKLSSDSSSSESKNVVLSDKKLEIKKKGMYHFVFVTHSMHSFTLTVSYSQYYNDKALRPRYLSIVESKAIKFKFFSFVIYSVSLYFIVSLYAEPLKNPGKSSKSGIINKLQTVSKVHYVIILMVFVRALFGLAEGVYLKHLDRYGKNDFTFLIYVLLGFLKTSVFLTSLILLGSGWSIIKPFLTENEKSTLYLVLAFQAFFFSFYLLEEKKYFSLESRALSMVLRYFIEMISIVLSYTPIESTIRRLKESAGVDGKAAANLTKIKQLKKFYFLVVVCYYGGEMSKWICMAIITPETSSLYFLLDFIVDLVLYFAIVYLFKPKKFMIERRKLNIEDLEELEDNMNMLGAEKIAV